MRISDWSSDVCSSDLGAFSVADDGSIAIAGSRPDRAADVWVHRRGTLRRLTDVNPQMRGWKLGKVEEVSWTSSGDGRPIYGVLVTPPALAPGVPSKTVVLAHRGPPASGSPAWQVHWTNGAQSLPRQ